MKTYREILSNASIYPFEATPAVNHHLEDEVIKANIKWLRAIRKQRVYAGWEDSLDDLVTDLEKELFATKKPNESRTSSDSQVQTNP